MRIDGNAAAVVGDGEEPVGAQLHLDERRVPGQRFVHRVVDDFRKQVVQRLLVGAADIHARPPPYWLEAFQHLDVAGGIVGLRAGIARGDLQRAAALRLGSAEQVVRSFRFSYFFQWLGHVSSSVARGPARAN